MKKTFFLILLFCSQFVLSQLNKPIAGPVFSTAKKENFNGFIGENARTVFTLDYAYSSRKKQELIVRRFDKNDLAYVDETDLYSVINEEYYNEPKEVFFHNDSLFLFSILESDKLNHKLIYLEIFNQFGEKLSEKTLDTLSFEDDYFIKEADNHRGFLIAHHNKFNNLAQQEITLYAVNNDGELLWNNAIKSPFALQSLSIEEIYYSTNAPVFILCNYGFEAGNKNIETDLINTKYALWAYKPEENYLKEFELRLKNRWINGIKMSYDDEAKLFISGYTNESRKKSINGVFSVIIDKDFEVIENNVYRFTRSFLAKFLTEKDLEKTKELSDIILRDIVVLPDGSYFLIGEHYYQYTERNYDPRTNITTTTENFNYNSILISYFDAKGKHTWSDRIPKFQHSINDYGYFSSYSILTNGNNLYLFFNDTDRNNELALDDYFNYKNNYNSRKFQVSVVHITREEIQSRGPIIDTENDFMIRAKRSYQINPKHIYLLGETGRNRKIFKVDMLEAQ
jgi:hypothetical protein